MAEQHNDPASPACAAHELSDAYLGYAPPEEILASLNELLEAERAGVKVAHESSQQAEGPLRDFLEGVRQDEGHWCTMLAGEIKTLGGTPSTTVGAFHGKAMAIADITARLSFLNKGQAWVAKRIESLTPRIASVKLRTKLREMLDGHTTNIARTNDVISAKSDSR